MSHSSAEEGKRLRPMSHISLSPAEFPRFLYVNVTEASGEESVHVRTGSIHADPRRGRCRRWVKRADNFTTSPTEISTNNWTTTGKRLFPVFPVLADRNKTNDDENGNGYVIFILTLLLPINWKPTVILIQLGNVINFLSRLNRKCSSKWNLPLFQKSNVTLSPISINGAQSETLAQPLPLIHFMASWRDSLALSPHTRCS